MVGKTAVEAVDVIPMVTMVAVMVNSGGLSISGGSGHQGDRGQEI